LFGPAVIAEQHHVVAFGGTGRCSQSRWQRRSPNTFIAEYVRRRIRPELGFVTDARDAEAMLAQGYRASRYSFGYPACPNLADQQQLLALIDAAAIGVSLSEEDQREPQQSTSAIVVHRAPPAGAKFLGVSRPLRGRAAKSSDLFDKLDGCVGLAA
jgi:hypothetical protein